MLSSCACLDPMVPHAGPQGQVDAGVLLPFTVVSGHHPQVKGWAGVLTPPLSKAGSCQWVLKVGCTWHHGTVPVDASSPRDPS